MRVAVVGSGASGMASAIILSRYGHEVTLFESGPRIAPLLRGFSRSGLHFDAGFHLAGELGRGGILRRYLNFLGIGKKLEYIPFQRDDAELYRFLAGSEGGARDVFMPQGLKPAAKTLTALYPEHKKAINEFFKSVEKAWAHSVFVSPQKVAKLNFSLQDSTPLTASFAGKNLPPRLEALLAGCCAYYGTPPQHAIFEEFALVHRSMRQDIFTFKGGGKALVEALEAALLESGVQVHTGAHVEEITCTGGSVTGVRFACKGEVKSLPFEACIYSGHPAALPGLLPTGTVRPSYQKHLQSLAETHTVFVLFGSVQSDFLQGRTLFLCPCDSLDAGMSGAEGSWVNITCGEKAANGLFPCMASIPCMLDESVLCNEAAYEEWKLKMQAKLLAAIRQHVPELGHFNVLESSGPRAMRHWIAGSRGGVYGPMHRKDQLPVLPFTKVKGLTLAGQGVILPGLLGTFVSAMLASGPVVGFEKMLRDFACTNAE